MTSATATATTMASDGPDTPDSAGRPDRPGGDTGARGATGTTKATRATETTRTYEALSLSAIGIEMGLAILVGWAVGRWLDGELGTAPWLMILFLGCGITAAFKPLIRLARQAKRKAAESNQTSHPDGDGPAGDGPAAQ